MRETFVPMFFPYLAHIIASQKISVSTTIGGYFAAKWPMGWQKVGDEACLIVSRGVPS